MKKTLIAYFSASGTTSKIAEALAQAADADIFEICPQNPYTAADLNWKNPLTRCNREKIGKKDVPISGKVENMEAYDTVLIGFPIWYYCAPNIINTFAKSYDWSGKKVALFATSGGSNTGKTIEKLRPYMTGNPEMTSARLFNDVPSDDDLKEWLKTI